MSHETSRMLDDHTLTALCARLRASDRNAFEQLFRGTRRSLLRFVNAIVRDDADAHDLVQDVFVALWATRGSLDPDQPLRPFLFAMARNRAYRHLRDTRRHAVKHEEIRSNGSLTHRIDPDEAARLDSGRLDGLLHRWLAELPDRQREALSLSRFHDLSHKEIASVMGISARTVNNHIVRALENLHGRLSAYESERDTR